MLVLISLFVHRRFSSGYQWRPVRCRSTVSHLWWCPVLVELLRASLSMCRSPRWWFRANQRREGKENEWVQESILFLRPSPDPMLRIRSEFPCHSSLPDRQHICRAWLSIHFVRVVTSHSTPWYVLVLLACTFVTRNTRFDASDATSATTRLYLIQLKFRPFEFFQFFQIITTLFD